MVPLMFSIEGALSILLLVETLRNVGDSARIGNHPVDSLFNCEILEADLARVQRIDEPL